LPIVSQFATQEHLIAAPPVSVANGNVARPAIIVTSATVTRFRSTPAFNTPAVTRAATARERLRITSPIAQVATTRVGTTRAAITIAAPGQAAARSPGINLQDSPAARLA
jgi:hypothetical protein